MNTQQLQKAEAVLEQAIDEFGLSNVLDVIASVCMEKAHHIRQSYDDIPLARVWAAASVHVGDASSKAMLKGL